MRLVPSLPALALLAVLPGVACGQTGAPNAPHQQPAFPEQTRAPQSPSGVEVATETVTDGLVHPWGLAVLPGGDALVTEKDGRMRVVGADGAVSEPIAGVPEVDARGQGGLLDVALDPDFADNRRVYWSYAEPRGEGRSATAVARGVLAEDRSALREVEVIFRQEPAWRSTAHYGSRLVFDREGRLFVTTGERQHEDVRRLAQDVTTHIGKVVRINADGSVPEGNPFAGETRGAGEVWSYGHRNLQAAALQPETGALWTVEHGPRGGDELNRPEAGVNHGWPVITYGEDYDGTPIGDGVTAKEGMAQPVYYWDPVIAPSGMIFYTGEMFPEWQGDPLIGGLRAQALVRLELEDGRVVGEERLVEGIGRVRDVAQAPDGSVLLLIDARNGRLVRLSPQTS